jgi:hypothetical protein
VLRKAFEVRVVGNHVFVLFSKSFLGVHSRLEVALFGVIGEDPIIVRHWEAVLHDVVNVYFGRVEQLRDMFIPFHGMVAVILPILGVFSVPFNYNEICV